MGRLPLNAIIGNRDLNAQWAIMISPRRSFGLPTVPNPPGVIPVPLWNQAVPDEVLLLSEMDSAISPVTMRWPADNPTGGPQAEFSFPEGSGLYSGCILQITGMKLAAAQSGPNQNDAISNQTAQIEIADPDGTFASYAENFKEIPGAKWYGYHNALALICVHIPQYDFYCRFIGTVTDYEGEVGKFRFSVSNIITDSLKQLLGSQPGDLGGVVRFTQTLYPYLDGSLLDTMAPVIYGIQANLGQQNQGGAHEPIGVSGYQSDGAWTPGNFEGRTLVVAGHPATLYPSAEAPDGNVYYDDPVTGNPTTFSNYCKVCILNSSIFPSNSPLSIVPKNVGGEWRYVLAPTPHGNNATGPCDFPISVPQFQPDGVTLNSLYAIITPTETAYYSEDGTTQEGTFLAPVPVNDTYNSVFNSTTGCQEIQFTLLPLPVDNTTSSPGSVFLFNMLTRVQPFKWDGKYNSLTLNNGPGSFNFDFLNDDLTRVWASGNEGGVAFWPANNAIPPRQTRQAILKVLGGQYGFTQDTYFRVDSTTNSTTLKVYDPNNILGPYSAYNGPGYGPANPANLTCELCYSGPPSSANITCDVMGIRGGGNLFTGHVMVNPVEILADFLLRYSTFGQATGCGIPLINPPTDPNGRPLAVSVAGKPPIGQNTDGVPIPFPATYFQTKAWFDDRLVQYGIIITSIDQSPADIVRQICNEAEIQLYEKEPLFLPISPQVSPVFEWSPVGLAAYSNPIDGTYPQASWQLYGRGPFAFFCLEVGIPMVPIKNILNTFQGWPAPLKSGWFINEHGILKDGQKPKHDTTELYNVLVCNYGKLPNSKTNQSYLGQFVVFQDEDSIQLYRGKYTAKDINFDGVYDGNTVRVLMQSKLWRFRDPLRRITLKVPHAQLLRNPGDMGVYFSTLFTTAPQGSASPTSRLIYLESMTVDAKEWTFDLQVLDVQEKLGYSFVLGNTDADWNTSPGYPTANEDPNNPAPNLTTILGTGTGTPGTAKYPGLGNKTLASYNGIAYQLGLLAYYGFLCNNDSPWNTPNNGEPTTLVENGQVNVSKATGFFSAYPNDPGKKVVGT